MVVEALLGCPQNGVEERTLDLRRRKERVVEQRREVVGGGAEAQILVIDDGQARRAIDRHQVARHEVPVARSLT